MAVKIKRSTTASSVPPSLVTGEIAINEADGKLYYRASTGTVTQFGPALFAALSHSHAASDITSGTIDIARIPTGSTSSTVCIGNDSRLSNARTPTSHVLATTSGLGGEHSVSGLTSGMVLMATGATTAAFQGIDAGNIASGSLAILRGGTSATDAATARSNLGAAPTASPAFTGAATFANTGNVVPLTITNAGTANSFVVNDASGDTTPFVIDASGQVGIGTNAPQRKLHVANDGAEGLEFFVGIFSGESRINAFNRSSSSWNKFSIGCSTLEFFVGSGGTSALAISSTGTATFAGQVLVTAGSGSSGSYKPGLAVSGDDDTGLMQTTSGGANTLSLVTAGNERLRVTDSRVFINGNGEQYGLGVRYVSTGGAVHFGATSNSATPDAAISNAGGGTLMTLQNGGNVGIGTTSPPEKLSVFGDNNAGRTSILIDNLDQRLKLSCFYQAGVGQYAEIQSTNNAETGHQNLILNRLGNNVGIGTAIAGTRLSVTGASAAQNGDGFTGIAQFSTGTGAQTDEKLVMGVVDGQYGWIQALKPGTATRAIILNPGGGEVLVSGTTDQGAYNLQCAFTGVWGAGAYVNGSDERIKDDIAPLSSCTDVIESLRPVTFRYKESWSKDQSIQPGFIAQDLQQALAGQPYLDGVVQQGTEYLSVAYQTLIPLLVKALQESNARIAALEERLNG